MKKTKSLTLVNEEAYDFSRLPEYAKAQHLKNSIRSRTRFHQKRLIGFIHEAQVIEARNSGNPIAAALNIEDRLRISFLNKAMSSERDCIRRLTNFYQVRFLDS